MKKRNTKIINFFGGPGIGKSGTAMLLAGLLKSNGVACEYASEAVKGHVWDENKRALDCQPKIFGDQLNELHQLIGKTDYVVTDSPLPINLLHNGFGVTENYKKWIIEVFNEFDNINILLTVDRDKRKYESEGRIESKERAIEMDKENNDMLNNNKIRFVVFDVHENTADNVFNYIAAQYLHDDKIKGRGKANVVVTNNDEMESTLWERIKNNEIIHHKELYTLFVEEEFDDNDKDFSFIDDDGKKYLFKVDNFFDLLREYGRRDIVDVITVSNGSISLMIDVGIAEKI